MSEAPTNTRLAIALGYGQRHATTDKGIPVRMSKWFALAILLSSCNDASCSDIGCTPGARLEFPWAITEPGDYLVRASIDSDDFECTFSLPDVEAESCFAHGLTWFGHAEEVASEGAVTETGAENVAGVLVDGVVATVSITIERDGGVVLSGTVQPEYRDIEIAGEGCGECPIAEAAIGD